MTQDRTSSVARGPSAGDGDSTRDLSGRCVGSSYLLVRPIGQGATGTVWHGVDRASGEPVAVKLLHESLLRQPKLVTRFVQERTILLMLRHRNVVRVRDLFSVGETLGLVMDLVGGGSLRDRGHARLRAGRREPGARPPVRGGPVVPVRARRPHRGELREGCAVHLVNSGNTVDRGRVHRYRDRHVRARSAAALVGGSRVRSLRR